MKKFILLFLTVIFSVSAFSPALTAFAEDEEVFTDEQISYYENLGLQGTVINVYNWGEYISDGLEGSMDVVRKTYRRNCQLYQL